jgi:hypothetical protein
MHTPSDVPAALRAFKRYYLPGAYENLYRRLSGQPAVEKPHLGRKREMPPLKKATALSEVKPQSEGFVASG